VKCPHCKVGTIFQRSGDFITMQGRIPINGCYLCGFIAIEPYRGRDETILFQEAEPCETDTKSLPE
jgi:hypothetical protein